LEKTVDRIIEHFDAFNLLNKDACAVFSVDGYQVLEANDCFREWTGETKDRSVFDLFPEIPADRFKRGISKRGRFSYQTTVSSPRRTSLDVNLSFRKIEAREREFIFVHGSDRSREKEKDAILARATKLLEQRNKELEKLNRELTKAHNRLIMSGKLTALGQMAASMIMEMQYPLQLIMVNASLLDDHMRDQEATEMLQAIVESSARVNKIVESLRGFSHDEAREPWKRRNVAALVNDTVNLCRKQIEEKGIRLEVGALDTGLVINCHPTEISQVLLNLVQNAAEAVDGDDEPWVRIDAVGSDGALRMSVTDSGGGLPSSLADKIMEPFFTTKDGAGSGTGLGLTISRKIIEGHRGALGLDADSNNTCFVVTLPLSNEASEEEEDQTASAI
jgi:C4-dicarboxylate-specific signal transduction histidine kinase